MDPVQPLAAARDLDRRFIGIELDLAHHRTAIDRLRSPQSESLSGIERLRKYKA